MTFQRIDAIDNFPLHNQDHLIIQSTIVPMDTTLILYQSPHFWQAATALIILTLYLTYFLKCRTPHFLIKGQHNVSRKNLKNPPPPYPNGWYNVCMTKELLPKQTKSIDINGHNLVVYRGANGQAYALAAYCLHLGANLGIGGEVVNEKCIQCPFHGWLYDGETGHCVDHDGKPLELRSLEYDCDGDTNRDKVEWKEKPAEKATLRKYPLTEMNGYLYVWIHSVEEKYEKPSYPMMDVSGFLSGLKYRGKTEHHIQCHLQDIPSNGADILHFKYVHTYMFQSVKSLFLRWTPKWKTADDPDIKELFEHPRKEIREYKQRIFKELIEPYPNKEILSIGNIQNWINLPVLGEYYMFSATIIQVGLGVVFILMKGPLYELVFKHYIRPVGRNKLEVFHECFISNHVPYFSSYKIVQMEGEQVTNDMYIWEGKTFARKLFLNQTKDTDKVMLDWYHWASQFYDGCGYQQEQDKYSW